MATDLAGDSDIGSLAQTDADIFGIIAGYRGNSMYLLWTYGQGGILVHADYLTRIAEIPYRIEHGIPTPDWELDRWVYAVRRELGL